MLLFAASAQADNVDWQVTAPGITVQNGVPARVTCYAIPCQPVTGKITDPKGRKIKQVLWSTDDGPAPYYFGDKDNDWSASWPYTAAGVYHLTVNVQYADNSVDTYGVRFDVSDPSNQNTQITYSIPDTLYQQDNTRNTFQVNYTGTEPPPDGVRVSITHRPDDTGYTLLTPLGDPWTTGAWHHAKFRVTNVPTGSDTITMESGDKVGLNAVRKDVTVIGAPQQPAFTNVSVKELLAKRADKCNLSLPLTLNTRNGGSASLEAGLAGQHPGKKWQRLVTAKKSGNLGVGTAQLRADKSFSLKNDPVATFMKDPAAQFSLVATKVVIKRKNGTTALNLKPRRYPVSRSKVAACSITKTVYSSAQL